MNTELRYEADGTPPAWLAFHDADVLTVRVDGRQRPAEIGGRRHSTVQTPSGPFAPFAVVAWLCYFSKKEAASKVWFSLLTI